MSIDPSRWMGMLRGMMAQIGEEKELSDEITRLEITALRSDLQSERVAPGAKEAAADRLCAIGKEIVNEDLRSIPWAFGELVGNLADVMELPTLSSEKRNEYAQTILALFTKWNSFSFVRIQTMEVGRNFAIALGMLFEVRDILPVWKMTAAENLISLSQKRDLVDNQDVFPHVCRPLTRSMGFVLRDSSTQALQKQQAASFIIQAANRPLSYEAKESSGEPIIMGAIVQGMADIVSSQDTLPLQKREAAQVLFFLINRSREVSTFSPRSIVNVYRGCGEILKGNILSAAEKESMVEFLVGSSQIVGLENDGVFNLALTYKTIQSTAGISCTTMQEVAQAWITLSCTKGVLSDETVALLAEGLVTLIQGEICTTEQKKAAANSLAVFSEREVLSQSSFDAIVKGLSFITNNVQDISPEEKKQFLTSVVWMQLKSLPKSEVERLRVSLMAEVPVATTTTTTTTTTTSGKQ